ncbi:tRNA (adenosine(37)-N6)-threonylcarbamoyltransferase complex ATPase subunit type 1 TsaE [Idiomarina sp. HP20-50]|uniref:tRNA (adenosine(37)-N6)-threonylcarbamoyltransferase complex ATPase subunit type 1 TsaE n=1 Tax=Idiomarina sp. HP20-50 TaxID=3070813 RepID=UPI00294B85C5|nr:tRNA (adenosine(37)-N6)-threonylcarbamoyltransferase complex ATPase subunit type 1 TsaE [Idiomarina sp. HP20-50]MDV6317288.1 tRNA (adenosine(37)-N6)-threonylcarbamoyltransferase complex ATPase subunit type 1 TsaE [Idiomarina sp. HP20-50]
MTEVHQFELGNEDETLALAKTFSQVLHVPLVVYLRGELGAGKTAFCRGVIQALGHVGAVKSPTYTLVEPYQLKGWRIHHFDLYRLADPEELEYMGIRDYFADDTLNFIEWPDKGAGWLPSADIEIRIEYAGNGRKITFSALTEAGHRIIKTL